MVNRLVSVNEDLELPPEVQEALVGPVRSEFQSLTTTATNAASAASDSALSASTDADEAETSAAAAQAAAETATAPTDTTVGSLILNDTSETSLALRARTGLRDKTYLSSDYPSLADAVTQSPAGSTLLVAGTHVLSAPLIINKKFHLKFLSDASITTNTGIDAIQISSSDVTIEDARITGSGSSTAGVANAIFALGDVSTPLTNIKIIRPQINEFNKHGILFEFCNNFRIVDPNIYNIAYAAVIVLSCVGGRVDGGFIRNLTMPSPFVNAYGIAISRRATSDLDVFPHSENIVVNGVTVQGVPWEGIDTHGSRNLTITDNLILGCAVGIALVPSVNAANVDTWGPQNIVCTGNVVDGRTASGTRQQGIKLVGAGAVVGSPVEAATGIIANNIIIDHGGDNAAAGLWGGIYLYFTSGVVVSNNIIRRPAGAGIHLYHSNAGVSVTGNVVEDVWTNAGSTTAAVYVRSPNNNGSISGTQILRGAKTATSVNARGLWVGTDSLNLFAADTSNRWDRAATPTVGTSVALRMGFYDKAPVIQQTGTPANATDLATAIALVNNLRGKLLQAGIFV